MTVWTYLQINALVMTAFLAFALLLKAGLRYRHLLWLARGVFVAGLLGVFLRFPQATRFISPSAQIWSAPTMKAKESRGVANQITVGKSRQMQALPTETLGWTFWLCAALLFAARVAPSARTLRRLYRGAYLLKRLGRLEILISDEVAIPFSFWLPGRALVFVPSYLLADPGAFKIAVRHELQHHRQGDTRWVYGLEFFRCAFIFNPFAHLWVKSFSEVQELACDEALVDRKQVSPHAYGGCLLKVAETARGFCPVLVGTTCMAANPSGSFLKRRITIMLDKKKRYPGASVGVVGGLLSCAVLATVAWATQGVVQDRRVTMQEAQRLATVIHLHSKFPITVNEAVLRQMNRYVGTPDGREFIKRALARMENYRPLIEAKLDAYRLPRELMAMPIMESGYQNLPQSENPLYSAGLWQFIPQTARNYALRVDATIDERLNVEKETDAAARYLSAEYLRFQDWELSILAYNAGEGRVQKAIEKTGSRNAWRLLENGTVGDEGYLPKIVAAILIMNSPQLLD